MIQHIPQWSGSFIALLETKLPRCWNRSKLSQTIGWCHFFCDRTNSTKRWMAFLVTLTAIVPPRTSKKWNISSAASKSAWEFTPVPQQWCAAWLKTSKLVNYATFICLFFFVFLSKYLQTCNITSIRWLLATRWGIGSTFVLRSSSWSYRLWRSWWIQTGEVSVRQLPAQSVFLLAVQCWCPQLHR